MDIDLLSSCGDMPIHMNFGCGNSLIENCVNIDISVSREIIEYATVNRIWLYRGKWSDPHQFPAGQFGSIFAKDVLEHFHPDEIANILYCFRCSMSVDAELNVVVPNFENMAKIISEHANQILDLKWLEKFRQIELNWMAPYIHGGVGHKSIWTKAIARYRIEREGFSVTEMDSSNDISLYIKAKKI